MWLIDKVRDWLHVEKQQTKTTTKDFASFAVPHVAKQYPASWLVNRDEFVQHVKNSTYIAIGAIARKCAMQPPEISRRVADGDSWKQEGVALNHPLVELFERINPFHTLFDFIYYSMGWKLATGDSFTWKARNGFGSPVELWPLPSQWVHAIPSTTEFISEYKVEGVWGNPRYLPASEIIHISDPNLDWSGTGRYYGRPTMLAAGSMIDIEEAIMSRMQSWFENYSPPGMVFSGAEGIGREQIFELYNILATQHAMNESTGRPFVVPEGFELETGAMSTPKDIDYGKQLDSVMSYILAVFGVPKAVVGIVQDSNRANMQAAMQTFAENTVNPLLMHLSQHMTQDLARDYDNNLEIRFPPVSVDDVEQMRKDFETALKYGVATPDEAREAMLQLPGYVTGGSRPLVPNAWTPAPMGNVEPSELEEEEPTEQPPPEETEQDEERDDEEQSDETEDQEKGLDSSRREILEAVESMMRRRAGLSRHGGNGEARHANTV